MHAYRPLVFLFCPAPPTQLGTHTRALRKREEMRSIFQAQKAGGAR